MRVTGRMHNRVRMVVASWLTKHLLTDWRIGLAHFEDSLTDWDPAANAMNWQWVAGCGPDASPFFRIFNPEKQAASFDPKSLYRDHWLTGEGRAPGVRLCLPPGTRLSTALLQTAPRSWIRAANVRSRRWRLLTANPGSGPRPVQIRVRADILHGILSFHVFEAGPIGSIPGPIACRRSGCRTRAVLLPPTASGPVSNPIACYMRPASLPVLPPTVQQMNPSRDNRFRVLLRACNERENRARPGIGVSALRRWLAQQPGVGLMS